MEAVGAAFHCAGPFERLLADPEMAHLVAAAPQAGRILRPFCRMLRVKRPAYLRPARRVEVTHAEVPPPQPSPASAGEGATSQGGREQEAAAVVYPLAAPAISKEEEAARRHAARPGGLYFDGTGLRWS